MKRIFALSLCVLAATCLYNSSFAQRRYGGGYGRMHQRRMPARQAEPQVKPSLSLSIGYGFPNLDKDQLVDFYNYYKGNTSQNGPITAALDYKLSNRLSIGVLATHGKVSVPYYEYNASAPAIKGSLDNYAIMLNIKRFLTSGGTINPYIRTAFGINIWQQAYTDAAGNNVLFGNETPSQFAYQAGIGLNFNLSKSSALFIEAGHGKYIVQGGLSFKL